MTTTMHQAFLDDIRAHPTDDVPRLIYADWLDEQGDVGRAEFIRVQCRIAAIEQTCLCGRCVKRRGGGQQHNGPCAADRRQEDGVRLRQREQELLWQTALWGADLPIPAHPANKCCVWRRGFIAEIRLPCQVFLDQGKAIWRATPLERVELSDKEPWPIEGTAPTAWWFEAGGGHDLRHQIPSEIMRHLPNEGVPDPDLAFGSSSNHPVFGARRRRIWRARGDNHRQKAKDALSQACIALLREEA